MTAFFICIMMIGIGLVVAAGVLVLAEKQRMHDMRGDLHARKDELFRIIEDAEVLVEELNRFSDYATTRCEEKERDLQRSMLRAEELSASIDRAADRLAAGTAEALEAASALRGAVSAESREMSEKSESREMSETSELREISEATESRKLRERQAFHASRHAAAEADAQEEPLPDSESAVVEPEPSEDAVASSGRRNATQSGRGRVLTADFKRSRIMDLQRSGLDSTEIAKRLNIGKGEIELITRIGSKG